MISLKLASTLKGFVGKILTGANRTVKQGLFTTPSPKIMTETKIDNKRKTSGGSGHESNSKRQKTNGSGMKRNKWHGYGKGRKRWEKRQKKMDPDPTSAEGVLTKYTIPKLLEEKGITEDQLFVNDGTHNWRFSRQIVENVHVLKADVQGDGIAIIDRQIDLNEEKREEATKKNQDKAAKQDSKDSNVELGNCDEIKSEMVTKKVVCVIPFAVPGDIVKVKLAEHRKVLNGIGFVRCDLLEVTVPSENRIADEQIPCKYFGLCSGCQLQSIAYEHQLRMKKQTIVNAYRFLMNEKLRKQEDIESKIQTTIGSPLLFGYRTKLTPHYDLKDVLQKPPKMPNIGIEAKGWPEWRMKHTDRSRVVDIEDCIIGTDIVRKGMVDERRRLQAKFDKEGSISKKGATVLLRENTTVLPTDEPLQGTKDGDTGEVSQEKCKIGDLECVKTCVTENKAIVSEYVGNLRFTFMANEFFQNNNSILPVVIKYIQGKLDLGKPEESYLVDAYCGSGLFSIASANSVKKCLGVEISPHSIKFARKNVEINHITNCEFIHGKAEKLFEQVEFPKDQTSVILDPPRKGCDKIFMDQLSAFEPKRIVYVSCNVHSQARDIDIFLSNTKNGSQYHIESIRGFDFFPQTYHVESVAVLTRT